MAEERINEQEDRFEKIVQKKNCFYQGDKKKLKKTQKSNTKDK